MTTNNVTLKYLAHHKYRQLKIETINRNYPNLDILAPKTTSWISLWSSNDLSLDSPLQPLNLSAILPSSSVISQSTLLTIIFEMVEKPRRGVELAS